MTDEKILEILWRDGYHCAASRMEHLLEEEEYLKAILDLAVLALDAVGDAEDEKDGRSNSVVNRSKNPKSIGTPKRTAFVNV